VIRSRRLVRGCWPSAACWAAAAEATRALGGRDHRGRHRGRLHQRRGGDLQHRGGVEAKVTGSQVETASRRVRIDLVAPGKPAIIDFTANVPGVFEVELEESGLKLFELQVQ
jgi:hypothetical protein